MKLCGTVQLPDSQLQVINIEIPDQFLEDNKKWVDLENKYKKEGDTLRRTLCSRAWAKIIKMASLVSLFDGSNKISDESYEWAEAAVEQELEFIQRTFHYESSDSLRDVVVSTVYNPIVKCLRGHYKSDKINASEKIRSKGIFTYTNISQALKGNTIIAELDDDTSRNNPKTGLEKILEYMLRSGLLTRVDEKELRRYGCKAKIGYKITDDFKLLGEITHD
jgi:hypothetical protein